MDLRAFPFDDRSDLHERAEEIFSTGWPEFIFHDPVADQRMDRARRWFGALNLLLVDAADRIVAGGWGVPVRWDGDTSTCLAAMTSRWCGRLTCARRAAGPTPW
ncbi:hypothetical protein ACWD6I_01050 [Streptomyces sp. NPDC002454]